MYTFLKLTPESREIYLEALEHSREYLTNFEYEKELVYLEKIKKKNKETNPECKDCTGGFAYYGPDGEETFRKIEAFICRRIF